MIKQSTSDIAFERYASLRRAEARDPALAADAGHVARVHIAYARFRLAWANTSSPC